MADILRCTDPRGREVVLGEHAWTVHVLPRRPYFRGNEACVRDTISQPAFVVQDIDDPSRHNDDRPSPLPPPYGEVYVKVVVDFASRGRLRSLTGTVITVHLTNAKKPGEQQLWP